MNSTQRQTNKEFNPNITKKTPSPAEFLKQAVGRKVTVKLYNNTEYNGILICLDGAMNIYLQQCEEIINKQITNKYPNIFIRGNNGKLIINNIVFYINSAITTKQK